jgi:hypothetical protein
VLAVGRSDDLGERREHALHHPQQILIVFHDENSRLCRRARRSSPHVRGHSILTIAWKGRAAEAVGW